MLKVYSNGDVVFKSPSLLITIDSTTYRKVGGANARYITAWGGVRLECDGKRIIQT